MECKLYEWMVKQSERELQVSVTQIRLQAQLIAKDMKVERFIASSQWANNFMKRKKFGVRRPTTKQQLPKQWEFQVAKFRSIITDLVKDLPDNQIGNFDEVSIQCDMPLDYTVDTKGATEVREKTRKNVLMSIYVFSKMVLNFRLLLFLAQRNFKRLAFLNQSLLL